MININTANKEALLEIVHIGPKRAQLIIEGRPYKDLHELSKITGLGSKRMQDILEQGPVVV